MPGQHAVRRSPLEAVRAYIKRHAPDRSEAPSCPVQPPYLAAGATSGYVWTVDGTGGGSWQVGGNGTDADEALEVLRRIGRGEQ